jgi:processed acidic surface protein
MYYKKTIFVPLVLFLLLTNIKIATAAPPSNELNQYLSEIGWTKQDLVKYLNYYEMPLEGFSSVADLKSALGSPINAKNLQDLMNKYNLSSQDLNKLLNHFGDSLKAYKFISDLDNSVAFYKYRQVYMTKIKNELAQIGVSQQEVNKFFRYLSQVEENNKNQLDQMQLLDYQIEQFLTTTDPTQLNSEKANQLAQILTQTFNLYDIQVKFKINNKDVALNDLLKMNTVPGDLYTAIASKTGDPLMDFTVSIKFFQAMINAWEELVHLGKVSNELVDYLHNEKYNDSNMFK